MELLAQILGKNNALLTEPEYTSNNNHYMQTPVWANVKRHSGWRIKEVRLNHPSLGQVELFLYLKKVNGVGTLAYAPMWPNIFNGISLAELKSELLNIAEHASVFAIRFEPAADKSLLNLQQIKSAGFQLPKHHIQYLSTIVVDLKPSEEEIFNSFNATARNEIRKAQKSGVVCSRIPITDDSLKLFETVLESTKKRQQKFYTRKNDFLNNYWQLFKLTGQGNLYITRLNYDVLCMAYVIKNGGQAFYKDGGAVIQPKTRQLYAPTFMQWKIMQDQKALGTTSYDLCGALATGIESEADPLWKVYGFKKKFNKTLTVYPGFIDLPVQNEKYQMWRKSEKFITYMHQAVTRDLWY